MATRRQNQYLSDIKSLISGISRFEAADLVQRERLGLELSFETASGIFSEVLELVREMNSIPFEKIPSSTLKKIKTSLDQIQDTFNRILTFSPAIPNSGPMRDELISKLEELWDDLYPTARLVLGPVSDGANRKELDSLVAQINTVLTLSSQATSRMEAAEEDVKKKLDDFFHANSERFVAQGQEKLRVVDEALSQVRKAAAEAGVSQHAKYFDTEADAYKTQARIWLVVLIACSMVLAGYAAFGNLFLEKLGEPNAVSGTQLVDLVRGLTQRALLAFVFLFAVVWSSKNYAAAKHNEVINRHRRNALGSFETFVKSASDEGTKNALLVQAAQSIFAQQQSGFVKADGENAGPSHIFEIVRGMASEKPKS